MQSVKEQHQLGLGDLLVLKQGHQPPFSLFVLFYSSFTDGVSSISPFIPRSAYRIRLRSLPTGMGQRGSTTDLQQQLGPVPTR